MVPADDLTALRADLTARLKVASPADGSTFRQALLRLKLLPADANSEDLTECLLLVAKYFYYFGSSSVAVEAATNALSRAKLLDCKSLLRKTYTYRGSMRGEAGDPRGLEDLIKALELARAVDRLDDEAPVLTNIAVRLSQNGQYAAAICCLQTVASIVESSPSFGVHERVIPYNNLAGCAIHTGEIRLGSEAALKSIRLNASPASTDTGFGRVIAEANLARLLVQGGCIEEAKEHAEAACLFAERFPSTRASFIANNAAGLVDICSGRAESGVARIVNGLRDVRNNFPGELPDVLTLCASAYEAAEMPETALNCLREYIAITRERQITVLSNLTLEEIEESADVRVDAHPLGQVHFTDAVRLEAEVETRLDRLVVTAINANLAAGYDLLKVFRVSKLAQLLGSKLGLTEDSNSALGLAAKLLDVGLIAMPAVLLAGHKPLTASERAVLDEHVKVGAELLVATHLEIAAKCAPVVRFHHEAWNGTGPSSLRGDAIPSEARIAAICDHFDSMVRPRSVGERATVMEALVEIQINSGSQFDPQYCSAFVELIKELGTTEQLLQLLEKEGNDNSYVRARQRLAAMTT